MIDTQAFARVGAEHRLEAIETEIAAILEAFPDLETTVPVPAEPTNGAKPHWTSTPEGKARMRRLMKKAWRKRKAAEGTAP